MKFTCDRSALVDKLGVLARGVSTRSALPVLSGILLQAGEGRLDLFSTDMELSIRANLATPVERDGEVVVPARLFTDVVRNLPDEEISIEAGEAAVKVSAGRAAFSLNAWAAGIRIITGETEGDRLFAGDERTWFGHFGEAYGLLAGVWADPETGDAVIYALTGSAFDPYADEGPTSTLTPIEAQILEQLGRLL